MIWNDPFLRSSIASPQKRILEAVVLFMNPINDLDAIMHHPRALV